MTDQPTALPGSIDATQDLLSGTGYVCGRALATVAFLSLKLGRPLFLEGEAGVGKTEIAKALATALGLPSQGSGALQENHFFDGPGGELRRAELALRLRSEEGRFTLTAKGRVLPGEPDDDGPLQRKREEEHVVERAQAEAILAGRACPLECLVAALGETRLMRDLRAALDGSSPIHVGCFQNLRHRLGPVQLPTNEGPPLELVFELDRTTFPGERVEHEIEVEVDGEDAAQRARPALLKLLEAHGIHWFETSSKAERFFRALTPELPPP